MTTDCVDQVFAFPDTNVLLHGRAPQSIPWPQLLGAQQVTLVLARSVLSELDSKMHDGPAALRSRAKKRAKWLYKVRIGEGPPLTPGLTIEFAGAAADSTYVDHELSRDWGDDRLLALVLEREGQELGQCVIVTLDYNMTSRADTCGLASLVLEDRYRLPIPLDPELARLRHEVDRLSLAHQYASLAISSEDQSGAVQLPLPSSRPLTEEEVDEEMEEVRGEHPMISRTPQGMILGAYFSMGERQIKEHNRSLENAYTEYRAFIYAREQFKLLVESTTLARFVIENSGSAPAKDVQVHIVLTAPHAAFVPPSALKKEPKPPTFPTMRGWDQILASDYMRRVPSTFSGLSPKPSRQLTVLDDNHAKFELDKLMHGVPEVLEIPIAVRQSGSPAGEVLPGPAGKVAFQIHADGQPAATTAQVALIVTK
jgi:hypothetical protein